MKRKYLFCTKIRIYLLELPVILLLVLSCIYNGNASNTFKLYPLIIFLSLLIVFILVYFFRVISISFEEVSYHGIFSSKDKAMINKDKELILTLNKRRRMSVELFGNDGKAPELDWIKEGENYTVTDIFLFRGKAIGTKGSAKRILRYFGVENEDIDLVFKNEKFFGDYEYVTLTSEKSDEKTVLRLKMKETV